VDLPAPYPAFHPDPAPSWWLPVAIALIPVVAVHAAWALATREGFVEPCIPYLDGCASISRVARHGTANLVFKLLMAPCALLQLVLWQRSRRWIAALARDPRCGATLAWLGVVAGVALVVYVLALGSEGMLYRFMRRYGITFYFAATYVAQLVFLRALLQRIGDRIAGSAPVARGMTATCVAMLAVGLASVAVSGWIELPDTKDRLENLLEWHLGVLLTGWFLLHALLWRRAAATG
jgi:hypothetical protein